MSTNLEEVCEIFNLTIEILKSTYEIYQPLVVLEKVCEAQDVLRSVFDPLLDLYNEDKEICKELYCKVRDLKETALTWMFYAKSTLEAYGEDIEPCVFGDVDSYIKNAVCYTIQAKDCLKCDESLSCDSTSISCSDCY